MTPHQLVHQLKTEIRRWDDSYYDDGSSPVSDEVYDAAKMRLRQLEQDNPELLTTDSPTLVIGQPARGKPSVYRKVAHHVPMLSLDTQVDTSVTPVVDFINRATDSRSLNPTSMVIEPKFDGLGLDLQYAGFQLIEAVTRGDGMEGDDVLVHARSIGGIPQFIKTLEKVDIRGEVLLRKSDLVEINAYNRENGLREYSNCRNAAAGLMRMKASHPHHSRLRFMAYQIAYGDTSALGKDASSHSGQMDFLESIGFNVRYYSVAHEGTSMTVEDWAAEVYKFYNLVLSERAELPYEIDGVVYKLDDLTLCEELGYTGREPNWALAHKFTAERAVTEVLAIKTGVGKTGRVTPVAVLRPVFVGGVTVTNGNLVHAGRIEHLGVRVGDQVEIQRAGDVVPEVLRVVRTVPLTDEDKAFVREATETLFRFCPACATPLVFEGAFWRCPGAAECPAQLESVLSVAVSRPFLNIQGLGEKTVEALIRNGHLQDPADIFYLNAEKLHDAGISPLLSPGIMENVERAKSHPLWRVIASLGIPTCGPTTAKELTKHYHSIAELRLATEKELEDKVDDVGEKTAAAIVRSFINEEMYNKLERVDSNWTTSAVKSNGMTVCITGSIPGWERSALKNAIEAIGYKTVGSVSAKTTIVIAGSGAGEKLAKAQKLKLRVLTTPEDVAALLAGQP